MARFSARVLSQLCATAQKTQTNEEAEASGAAPGEIAGSPTPGKRRGGGCDRPYPADSERNVGMTGSRSCPPGPPGLAARSPQCSLAAPPLQSLGGSLHDTGSEGAGSEVGARVHPVPSGLCRQQLRQRVPAGSRESEPESSSPPLQRLVNLAPWEARGGVRARACGCVGAHRHAWAPLHTRAPTYWPRRRQEPWPPKMLPSLPHRRCSVANAQDGLGRAGSGAPAQVTLILVRLVSWVQAQRSPLVMFM